MNHLEPLISVIVPTYNTEAYLDGCLGSIRGQDYRKLEIICLNDGSTDASLEIMERHAAADPRIRVIDKENEGYGATCNRGLDEAQGAYISIIEPDDWIEQGMYAAMASFAGGFAAEPDIVKTAYWRITMPDTPQQQRLNCSYRGRVKPPAQPFLIKDAPHLLGHHPSIWSAIYRTGFLEEAGIRFPEYPGAGWADNPFFIETYCLAQSIVYLDRAYYCYREDTPEQFSAFTRKNTLMPIERWNDIADIIDRLGPVDPVVRREVDRRGINYLDGIVGELGFEDPALVEAARGMFERMDAGSVFADEAVPPVWKERFAELRGIPLPDIDASAYRKFIVKQGLYNLKNTGLSHTLKETMLFLGGGKDKAD